jgi:hypothetical protein
MLPQIDPLMAQNIEEQAMTPQKMYFATNKMVYDSPITTLD